MSEVRGEFLILRKIPYGESDLIVHAMGQKGEKKSFIAKGALRSRKRFPGDVLEPTHHVHFLFKENPNGMNLLLEASLINDFDKIRSDYDRLDLAFQFLKAASAVSQEGDEESKNLYFLLGHTLKALESAKDLETLKVHFYIKFLRQQGVLPEVAWVQSFLEQSIRQSDLLREVREANRDDARRLLKMAEDYLKTAESHSMMLNQG